MSIGLRLPLISAQPITIPITITAPICTDFYYYYNYYAKNYALPLVTITIANNYYCPPPLSNPPAPAQPSSLSYWPTPVALGHLSFSRAPVAPL